MITENIYRNSNPFWGFFTTIYGIIIGFSFQNIANFLSADNFIKKLLDKEVISIVILYLLTITLIIIDWLWVSSYLADFPKKKYYNRFKECTSIKRFLLLLFNSIYIIAYGISFLLLPNWKPYKVLLVSWDNPLLWFVISVFFSNIWDTVSYSAKFNRPNILYLLNMWIIFLAISAWIFQWIPNSIGSFITNHQFPLFSIILANIILWRMFGLISTVGAKA